MTPQTMDPFGSHRLFPEIGRRITMDTGYGFLLGAGLGLMMNLGDSLHSIMAVGFMAMATGVGPPGRIGVVLSMPQLWWLGLADRAGEAILVSALEVELAGVRWAGVNHSFPGTTQGLATLTASTSTTRALRTSIASATVSDVPASVGASIMQI